MSCSYEHRVALRYYPCKLKDNKAYVNKNIIHNTLHHYMNFNAHANSLISVYYMTLCSFLIISIRSCWPSHVMLCALRIKPVYSNTKAPERGCNRLNGACNESVYYFSPVF